LIPGIGYPLQYSWASLVALMVKKKERKKEKSATMPEACV